MQRRTLLAAMLAASSLCAAPGAMADTYPSRQVRIIIPFPPGGTLDTLGRNLAQRLSDQTGQSFVVENRAGGNGIIGADAVAKSAPDGYTLMFNASTVTTTPMTMKSVPFDVVRDFQPISLVAQAPLSVAVNKALPFNDVKGLLAYAKSHPGELTFAVGSTGSAGYLATELLRRAGDMNYLIVPYKGSAPAYQDLVGGQISGFIDPVLGAMSYYKGGMLKVIAVTSKARVPTLPEVPTVGETVPGYEFYSWYGLWGPARMPIEIAKKLNAEVNKAVESGMRDKFEPQGLLLKTGSIEDFAKFQGEDMARAQKIITEGNIRAE
ncbi:twin-arginine translocation pathway signal [Pigmentiphaga sp. NML080357]|uniref:Bug family tripartite tricarboxylate transporter substrate binding protein n=1 Tax=Pigmentiphaga sp. NML080357 TaxID=2008675 RepID=UPI000B410338|nr:tripartite tricarboxylate transporter substrate binding protein [Pigmentiphaga sp. NML080357]OVZ57446.1 twin-arginine translocation pathway signal [Pigmentiphaga sp. NML080357]